VRSKVKLHVVEVLSRERFGNHVLLRYRWTGDPPEPGQFIMVRSRASARASEPFLSRPFFAHDYDDGVMSLLFEVRGRGTALLAEDIEKLAVSKPLGRGFVFDNGKPNGASEALIGGGVWVSPLKLLRGRLSRSGIPHDVYLEVPKSAPDAYGAWISENYPGAVLVPTDAPSDAPKTVLDRLGDLTRYSGIYASGPAATLSAVRDASMASGVPAQLALRERMACANGSCYGCTVPVWESGARTYARVCVEGPVFSADSVSLMSNKRWQ
jgi:dihydroorotate dehydrogenase electron transfer subunit